MRVYKHDFLNHLQVIYGYLQLKKPELALQYVQEAIEDIQDNGSVMRLELPELISWLLFTQAELEEQGIKLNLQNDAEFTKLVSWETDLLAYFKTLEQRIRPKMNRLPLQDKVWEISFDGNGPYEITFLLPELENDGWLECFEQETPWMKTLGAKTNCRTEKGNFMFQLLLFV